MNAIVRSATIVTEHVLPDTLLQPLITVLTLDTY
jgi:hypothetical protein